MKFPVSARRVYDRLPAPLRRLLTARELSLPYLWAECVGIFVGFPIVLYFIRHDFGPWLVQVLVVTALGAFCALLLDPDFERRRLGSMGSWTSLADTLRRILKSFVPGALLCTALVLWLRPELFLRFPQSQPRLFAVVMVFYPLLSVYPQEILFRTFFFHRYRRILGSDRALIVASAIVFGLAHLFFANWIAPLLTTVGGWLFARTYARTESTLQCSLEHGLWGDFLFTVGLGWYFWSGSIS